MNCKRKHLEKPLVEAQAKKRSNNPKLTRAVKEIVGEYIEALRLLAKE